MRSVIDTVELSVEELEELISTAQDIIAHPSKYAHVCDGKKLATLFFEPSTRTRMSFEAAMYELGGNVLSMPDAASSSVAKGESVSDTAKVMSCYADIIAIRHPKEGAALVAAKKASIPVINAGDGGHCHPTQTLADLLTIFREKGRFDHLTVGLCGDLQFGRVEIKQITNIGDVIMHQAEPVTDFRPEGTIYEIDKKNKCVNYGISFTSLADRVWKEFKKQEETK